jgi:hypothetical protein
MPLIVSISHSAFQSGCSVLRLISICDLNFLSIIVVHATRRRFKTPVTVFQIVFRNHLIHFHAFFNCNWRKFWWQNLRNFIETRLLLHRIITNLLFWFVSRANYDRFWWDKLPCLDGNMLVSLIIIVRILSYFMSVLIIRHSFCGFSINNLFFIGLWSCSLSSFSSKSTGFAFSFSLYHVK